MGDRELLSPKGDYEPPASLWKLITSYISESEWEEVKIMLGEDLVEQSIELQQEVSTLLEIWHEYREETQKTLQRPRLPEPPAARDRLKQEIQFFVQSLQDKAKENGRDPQLVLSRHNSTVIDYALDSGYSSSSLPSTGRSSSGCSTPCKTPESARSTTQVRIAMKEELATMNDKLSVYKIDTVVKHLQQALQEEVDNLLADTEFLQRCLNDEVDVRSESSMSISREPSLADMREERSKLEKELLTPDSPVHDQAKLPPRREVSSLSHKGLSSVRPSSSTKSLGPLKASHSIQATSLQLHTDSPSPPSSASHRPNVRRVGQFSQRTPSAESRSSRPDSGSSMHALNTNLSHVTVMTRPAKSENKIQTEEAASLMPTPPKNAKPKSATQRPRSAQRFRQMVMNCRDGT